MNITLTERTGGTVIAATVDDDTTTGLGAVWGPAADGTGEWFMVTSAAAPGGGRAGRHPDQPTAVRALRTALNLPDTDHEGTPHTMTTTTKERRQHVTVLDGPDGAGHWGYRCTDPDCGEHRSGYDPDQVAEQAELHGPVDGADR